MAKNFFLEIVTPDRLFFSGEVEALIVNTPHGKMEVMYQTLPMVTCVDSGLITVVQNGRRMEAATSVGFIKVDKKVSLMLNSCKWPYEAEVGEESPEIKRLNDRIKKAQSLKEYRTVKTQLAIQLAKLKSKEKTTE